MAKQTEKKTRIEIAAPNMQTAAFEIEGTSPYVQNAFSAKARETMKQTQEEGSTSKGRKKREPKDFAALYEDSMHKTAKGKCGIPAPAFRSAMIDACRAAGYAMTRAKIAVFVLADDIDANDGTPLVLITKGKPQHVEHCVRLKGNITDIRARAMWQPGWRAKVRVQFDASMLRLVDVGHLMVRAGMQVGIGEGRPSSKDSHGMGWGMFTVQK